MLAGFGLPRSSKAMSYSSVAQPKKRIAIVGSGISGLATLYSLRNSGHDVHLYEQAHRLGGHTNTVEWEHDGNKCKVDTGFIVLNSFTYRKPPSLSFREVGSLILTQKQQTL
jgi:predicted NAD/FAD-binding protein